MQKNWHVVYTKPNCEKKVTTSLTKRKIENFCPYNRKQLQHLRKHKFVVEPLFQSFVFVNIPDEDIPLVERFENVIGLVYWRFRLAIIKEEEILIIKDFISHHTNIKLEKNRINPNNYLKNTDDGTNYTIDGKVLRIISRSIKVNLPSLGFTMIAEIDEVDGINGKAILHGSNNLLLQ